MRTFKDFLIEEEIREEDEWLEALCESEAEYLEEAEYQGKTVELNKPKRGGSKKFYVYTKNHKGNVVKVSFGDTTGLSIKKNNPKAKASFRARHGCDVNPGPRWKAKYWSCKNW